MESDKELSFSQEISYKKIFWWRKVEAMETGYIFIKKKSLTLHLDQKLFEEYSKVRLYDSIEFF